MPPIILVLFFGPIADRYGRKIVMIIAFVGFLCWSTIMTVVVSYDLDKRYIFIANFIWGCCGYYLSAVVAILAYVSDRTNSENRAFRIGENHCKVNFQVKSLLSVLNFVFEGKRK